jgi:hypothetical protein
MTKSLFQDGKLIPTRSPLVPSPLVGAGQKEGVLGRSTAHGPFTLALCEALINQGLTGRGNLAPTKSGFPPARERQSSR